MLPYSPYEEDVELIEGMPSEYSISFRDIKYGPTNNITALGVLLFGLRPRGINFDMRSDLDVPMHLMQHAAYILHLHANGDRHSADGFRRISESDLASWIESAADLAPSSEAADFVRECIDAALGPYAYLSDEEFCEKGR